jgi:hypothetical protein
LRFHKICFSYLLVRDFRTSFNCLSAWEFSIGLRDNQLYLVDKLYLHFLIGGTGSSPPSLKGWHFNNRFVDNQQPFITPNRSRA